ncbi:MAG: hypothetical protein Q7T80_09335 [Methanoregula sp.]|nr:hypothetical protein [Methanoregula sp.]
MKHLKLVTVLLALLLAAMAMVPIVSAVDEASAAATHSKAQITQNTIHTDSRSPQMSESDIQNYVKQMSEKYGSEKVQALKVAASSSGDPDFYSGMSRTGAWQYPLNTGGAHSDNVLFLYKANQVDASGKDNYYYWHWSSASPASGHDITRFWSKNQITSSNSQVSVYSPDSASSGNAITVNVAVSGYGASIGGPFTLHQDTVRPKYGECQVGTGGKYTVEWQGLYWDAQSIKGSELVLVPHGQAITSDWTPHLENI